MSCDHPLLFDDFWTFSPKNIVFGYKKSSCGTFRLQVGFLLNILLYVKSWNNLRRMQQLLGESQLESSIMTQLFLQRLPTNAQFILASSQDTLDTESLAKLADKILEVAPTHSTPPTLSTVAPPSAPQPDPSTELRDLRELVSQLTTTINNFSQNFSPFCYPRRSRSRSNTHNSHNHTDRDRRVWSISISQRTGNNTCALKVLCRCHCKRKGKK